jgi:hypothetical protein
MSSATRGRRLRRGVRMGWRAELRGMGRRGRVVRTRMKVDESGFGPGAGRAVDEDGSGVRDMVQVCDVGVVV